MDQKELKEALKQAGVEVSDVDKFWMEKVHLHRQAGNSPTTGELLVQYHDDLPADYIPSEEIDGRLYSDNSEGPKLSVLGILLVDGNSEIPEHVDAVLKTARAIILDEPDTTEIEAIEVTDRLEDNPQHPDLEIEEVERAFGYVSDLGSFRTSASGAKHADEGYSRMGFSRDPEAYVLEYLNYEDFDSLLESKIEDIERREESGGLVTSGGFSRSAVGSTLGVAVGESEVQTREDRIDTIRNTAFIMMPMNPDEPFLEDVNNAIKKVCSDFGIEAIRADDVEHSRQITEVVLEHIEHCEFLIADLTNARPNVYYEVGYAHALDKRPILYRREGADLHFDLSVHNVPGYKNITDLKEQLGDRFEAIMGRKSGSAE